MSQKRSIKLPQETITKLEQMNLVDQFLFNEVIKYQDAFEAVISILLEKDVHLLSSAETEKEFRISPELRSTRLDSVGVDVNHKVYMVEMQKRNTGNLRRRSRLYQGHVDISLLEPGSVDFNRLKDVCQIMVTPFDLFGRKLYRYTFIGVCIECPDLKIEDGAWRVFINTKGKNHEKFSQEFLDFMEYIMHSTAECAERTASERIKLIHQRVTEVKNSEKTGVKAMQLWEAFVIEREEGREELLIELICRKLRKGKEPEKIADDLEEEVDTIRSICQVADDFGPDYDYKKVYEAWAAKQEKFLYESEDYE